MADPATWSAIASSFFSGATAGAVGTTAAGVGGSIAAGAGLATTVVGASKVAGKAMKPKLGSPLQAAGITQQEQGRPASEEFMGSVRRRRQIASTVSGGGQQRRNTLG